MLNPSLFVRFLTSGKERKRERTAKWLSVLEEAGFIPGVACDPGTGQSGDRLRQSNNAEPRLFHQ